MYTHTRDHCPLRAERIVSIFMYNKSLQNSLSNTVSKCCLRILCWEPGWTENEKRRRMSRVLVRDIPGCAIGPPCALRPGASPECRYILCVYICTSRVYMWPRASAGSRAPRWSYSRGALTLRYFIYRYVCTRGLSDRGYGIRSVVLRLEFRISVGRTWNDFQSSEQNVGLCSSLDFEFTQLNSR